MIELQVSQGLTHCGSSLALTRLDLDMLGLLQRIPLRRCIARFPQNFSAETLSCDINTDPDKQTVCFPDSSRIKANIGQDLVPDKCVFKRQIHENTNLFGELFIVLLITVCF